MGPPFGEGSREPLDAKSKTRRAAAPASGTSQNARVPCRDRPGCDGEERCASAPRRVEVAPLWLLCPGQGPLHRPLGGPGGASQRDVLRAAQGSPHFHALAPDTVFLENQQGDIELRRLPKPKLEEIERLVERIARRTLAMLKKELGEDLRLDALDRLRASNLQQPA